jgi:hypothetical protein
MQRQIRPAFFHARPFKACAMAVALAIGGGAHAADDAPAGPSWTFGGFGTVGASHSSERHADFTSSALKAYGAGYTNKWSFDVDSRLGAQLTVNLDKQWSGVVQVVSEQNLENNYRPRLEWGYIKYQATPDLSVRVGRIALPIFLAADYRKAAYAYPWARTPVEIYGAVPVSHSDGIDASYRWHSGSLKNVTQVFVGHYSERLYDNVHLSGTGIKGVSNTTEYGAASVRLSYLSANLTFDYARPVFDGFRMFGPQGAAIAERYDVDDKRVQGLSFGVNYDPGKWFLMAEAGRFNSHSFLGSTTSLYASGGYRAGDFTPYLSYARSRTNDPTTSPGLDLSGLPGPVAAQGAVLNGTLNWLLSTIPIQDTITAGVRWDVLPSVALKMQYDRLRPRGGSNGTLVNVQPGFVHGRPVHVASVVLDFVF